ncbi:MAG TPA: S-adenosylmethionine:tRNA ribosyltransferase-isomerase [Polyangiaceae bacterium]
MASRLTTKRRTPRTAPFALRALPPPTIPPAAWPRDDRKAQRLLLIDPATSTLSDRSLRELPELLLAGDLLVFNDAATLPASLWATTGSGSGLELRLARERAGRYWAVVLGAGDWRARTEDRKPPPPLSMGERLTLTRSGHTAALLTASVVDLAPLGTAYSPEHPLIALEFEADGAALWDALYRAGRPIQYSYVERPLEPWHVQNVFASRPWAFELPSAAHGFDWELLLALRRRGVRLAALTHAAGISSTGSLELDRRLPFPERYEIPPETALEVARAQRQGHRVVAVGTTVVRALESAWTGARLRAGAGEATLTLGARQPRKSPRVVDAVISGIHQAGEPHYSLLEAFVPAPLLARAEAHARAGGYHAHEFGDACLVLGSSQGDSAA